MGALGSSSIRWTISGSILLIGEPGQSFGIYREAQTTTLVVGRTVIIKEIKPIM